MSFLEINNVKISGISACVPEQTFENAHASFFASVKEAETFIETVGVEKVHLSKKTTSDLCFAAAEKIIQDLQWEKNTIDALIFVSQTADYILPATSCILQDKLGLSKECYAMDISLGCSGWVYGLSTAANLVSTGMMKRALLLCGDAAGHAVKIGVSDKSHGPLFGHAGTVTALEYTPDSPGFKFHFATDGSGYEAIIIPEGGSRNPFNKHSLDLKEVEPGIKRHGLATVMNGMDVFSFGITKVPQSVKKLSERFGIVLDTVDCVVLHQANKMMLESIRKKLKFPPEKVPYCLKNFGNTSSASIPLTIVSELRNNARGQYICSGFGVGLSWATVALELTDTVIPEVIEI